MLTKPAILLLTLSSLTLAQQIGTVGDWPDWRGPDRDGVSKEKGLPEKWSLKGENLAWKAPYGGRSTPVVLGDHLYLQNTAGKTDTEQERIMCFNADSGKQLWDHSITEEFSPFTTHGGRTVSPIIDGNLLIVSTPTSTWGSMGNRSQRFIALDKKTGDIVWISTPGGRPYDTSYAPMNIVDVNGTRLLVTGGGDGSAKAVKPQTGEPVWNLVIAKRGLNTGLVLNGKYAIVSHSEENLDSNEMGMLAAFDATGKGKLGKESIKWADKGV